MSALGEIGPTMMAIGAVGADPDAMWLACEHPERPPDANVMYHVIPDCHGCTVAEEARRRRDEARP